MPPAITDGSEIYPYRDDVSAYSHFVEIVSIATAYVL